MIRVVTVTDTGCATAAPFWNFHSKTVARIERETSQLTSLAPAFTIADQPACLT